MDESISRSKQLRGRLVVGIRRGCTQPMSRRLSVSLFGRYHRLRRRLAPKRYTEAAPCAARWVDPARITHSLLAVAPPYPQWGRVVDGGWDQNATPFADRRVVRAITQHFEQEIPWDETALTTAYAEQLERFGNAWEHTSWAGFETRCAEIEALYDSLREDGYQRAGQRDSRLADSLAGLIAEINVDIGRDGEVLWRGYGQHRLAMAQLLGLESVPVVVNRRHRQWQAVRNRLRADPRPATIDSDHRAHPDLQDLIDRRD